LWRESAPPEERAEAPIRWPHMRYGTVLFDLDGTLIDSGAAILASFHHATETVLGRRYADDVVMASVGGHGIHRQMAAFDEDRVDDLVAAYRAHNVELYRDIRLFAGVEPVLEALRDEERKLGVVTVKSRMTVDLTFELLPLGEYFDVVVSGDDVTEHKPDPAGLLRALELLDASPGDAAYVGDSPFDLQAATAAGIGSVGVTWGGIHGRDRLEPERPTALVDSPEELLGVL
jgi:pyrophosphatase PpaX